MLEKNRHHTLMILIIVLVSVFLFVSCGEPTFCELSDISISSYSAQAFTISGTDDDLSLIEKGPGLILCYYITTTAEPYSNISSKAISKFKTSSSPVLIVNTSDSSIAELTEISGTDDYTLYAFTDSSSNIPKSPTYSIDLSQYVSGTTLNAQFTDGTINTTDKTYSISDGTNTYTFKYSNNDDHGHTFEASGARLVILAAFTSGVGDFSNVYWSSLKQIGYFDY